jgi:hypothetical protein
MCALAETIDAPVASKNKVCGKGPCSGQCKRTAAMLALQTETAAPPPPLFPMPISEAFAGDILKPYRKHAIYLKSAEITQFNDKASLQADPGAQRLVTGKGRFAIPESCYIDDTGHFNAVEFNICYNQLAYVLFAKCVDADLMHRLRTDKVDVPSMAEFKHHQLPAMVIVSLESRYYKQLDSSDFTGEITIDKISPVGPAWFFFTSVTFADKDGVKAKGSVVLAFSPSFNPVRH